MLDVLAPFYSWIKVVHLAAVISWMAGMFYLPRLFVYHAERGKAGSELDEVYQIMEFKLYKLIMTPAMGVTWLAGLVLIGFGGFDFGMAWSWVKLLAVFAMTITHVWLGVRMKEFAAGSNTRTGRQYRLINEVPTVLMVVILIAVIVRPI